MNDAIALTICQARRRRSIASVAAILFALAAAACSSNSATITSPSPNKCDLTLAMSGSAIDAAGGTGAATITTTPECTWTASAQVPWVSAITPASGQGSGELQFRVAANTLPSPRETELLVNTQRGVIRQAAAACTYEVAPETRAVPAGGGAESIAITTLSGCAWSATTDVPWISVTPASGSGAGTVQISVTANESAQRTGTVRVADRLVTVTQSAAAAACTYNVAPKTQSVPVAGGSAGPITVTTTAACAWSAVSDVPWITITSGAGGNGNGVVTYSVAANSGSGRTGTLTIAGETVVITQAGVASCSYSVTPGAQNVGASGGAQPPIQVSTSASCAWTASTTVPWITIVNGASGSGNGTVTYQVAANTGAARSTTLTVAGRAVTVTQEGAPCSYAISPSRETVGSRGGAGSPIALTTGAACSWTVTTDVPWISITSSTAGTGGTTITYSVAPNSSGARTGHITVAGQTFTVEQSEIACAYSIEPASQSLPAAGGTGTIRLDTTSNCSWTAASDSSWITVTSPTSGTGPTTATFGVAANTGSERRGNVTIGGRTFAITQAAAAPVCTFAVDPASHTIPGAGGNGSSTVTTQAACAWTASTTAPWITITSGASGTGPGAVSFTAALNPGAARSGIINVANQAITVNQGALDCTARIAPTSHAAPTGGGPVTVDVRVQAGCAWTARSNVPWLMVASGDAGNGDGAVTIAVSANTGAARTGTVTIAGETFTVTQAPNCTFTLSQTNLSVPATGSLGTTVTVTAPGGCAWTATSNVPWITITSGQSGSGDGSVALLVVINIGAARTGTVTIAGETLTVNQAGLLPGP